MFFLKCFVNSNRKVYHLGTHEIESKKDILPLQYIAALEEKYAEQVEVNRQLLKTVQEQMLEISRLEERLRTRRGALSVDDLLSMADHTGEA